MKTLLVLLAAVGLTGCAVYPGPAYEPYGGPASYPVDPPIYIYGAGVYRPGGHPRGYHRPLLPPPPPVVVLPRHRHHERLAPAPLPAPGIMPQPGSPFGRMPHPRHGAGDRDRDGIPDRLERDGHGDGPRNGQDRWPRPGSRP